MNGSRFAAPAPETETYLLIRLSAPLASFGNARVDALGPTSHHPPVSMLTGLLASALGYRYPRDAEDLDRLQERMSITSVTERRGEQYSTLTDFQTVIDPAPKSAWTTTGRAEAVRTAIKPNTVSPYLRYRDYIQDLHLHTAISLDPASELPTLRDIAAALARPARPLYIGRKACAPQDRVLLGLADAPDPLTALATSVEMRGEMQSVAMSGNHVSHAPSRATTVSSTDRRNWSDGGLHGGEEPTALFEIETPERP